MNTAVANDNPLQQWPLAIGLGLLTVSLGGYLGGCAIEEFGTTGAIALWATGAAAGWLATKCLQPSRTVGYLLAASVVLAFVVAETCWIRWSIVGADSWTKAIGMLPTFFREYSTSALLGGLATFFGASSAYRQAGFRYKYVRVVEE